MARWLPLALLLLPSVVAADEPSSQANYGELVLTDNPAVYWRFSSAEGNTVEPNVVSTDTPLPGKLEGAASLGQPGPQARHYPLFGSENLALTIGQSRAFLRVADPGEASVLDFDNGDAITMEAWINPESITNDQHLYIIGKGRTQNKGVPADNQNYALRLRGMGGTARISFLFRNAKNRDRNGFHRWNSSDGFDVDGRWHHVAVVYEFGKPDSLRAYIDGAEVAGTWDIGGPTDLPPVVDNDELWIGSSIGGNPNTTFHGGIDEVAIYRHVVPAERLKARYQAIEPDLKEEEFAAAVDLADRRVTVDLHERIPPARSWTFGLDKPSNRYEQTSFAFVGLPKKYNSQGVIADRGNPSLLRARTKLSVSASEAGEYQILLRSKGASRFFLDGTLVTKTNPTNRNSSGHEAVPELAKSVHEHLRLPPAAHQEQLAAIDLTEGTHVLRLDAIIGGKGLRLELEELCVAIAKPGEPFQLLVANGAAPIEMTDEAWDRHAAELRSELVRLDHVNRRNAAEKWEQHWSERHEIARQTIGERPLLAVPESLHEYPAHNEVDHFLNERLADAGVKPSALTDDYTFLRRVTLDTVGVAPTRAEIAGLLADRTPERRALVIDRLLEDPRWADHWVGYWQDVLAENPGILKPKLNNTGPFRWWIYESFLDNKPMDRFVAELVLMGGSKYYGGPAGFAMATQNDAPFAAKAHVLAKAFLGMDMTCARCHDAPYHPFKQQQLFNLAAMLERKPVKLPKTSTVPSSEGARQPLVEISLKPGDQIDPSWPFAHVVAISDVQATTGGASDSRQQLVDLVTSPHNDRFAKVIVNRLWQRYFGIGLIDPVDDWESVDGKASHPELLDFLARELMSNGYDLKHVARLILNSHAYQRAVDDALVEHHELFATPIRRRMTAEQVVDSLVTVSGKPLATELLTLDPDGRRPVESFLNLGRPTRAWEFTSLSNERDRPALALPAAQSVIDLLLVYGWRDSRPQSLTIRDETPTVLQPLILANGIAGARAVRLSDDSALTQLSLQDLDVYELVNQMTLQLVSRMPTDDERQMFVELLREGFDTRIIELKDGSRRPPRRRRNAVSWSNHLNAEATKIKQELERAVLAGDPPTERLQADWRERMEDVVWALINSPEFVFVP